MILRKDALAPHFTGARAISTAIYFLLDGNNFSAFHRLRSDEMWHFYLGGSLLITVIGEDGDYSEIKLGSDPESGETMQAVVKAGCWFASRVLPSRVKDRNSFALVGCTVSPGFDFEDFELAKREELARRYPQHRALITNLTRI
ncbi:MAG: cupin domain-containing protein [Candidatus Sulfotelmatobacter sp.]